MQCQVLRAFSGPDGLFEPGAIVDTAAWRPRNRRVLIERRYLQPLPPYGTLNPDAPQPPASPATTAKRGHKESA